MECKKTRGLLSEYIDGTLDVKARKTVDDHLKTCKGCKEELGALKACISEVSSLKGVKAPDDFMERVHQRIEERFVFKNILRKLFIPLQVKIPLEVAAVVATVLLVVHITNRIQPIREVRFRSVVDEVSELEKGIAVEEPLGVVGKLQDGSAAPKKAPEPAGARTREELGEVERLAHKKAVSKSVPVPEAIKEVATAGEEPIELALLIKTEEPIWNKFFGEIGLEMKAKKEAEIAPADTETIQVVKTGAREYDKEDLLDRRKKRAEEKRPGLPDTISYEVAIEKDTKALSSPHLDEVISRIRNLTELVEGEVVNIEYLEDTSLPYIISVDIPAAKTGTFIERIGEIGSLKEDVPLKIERDKETVSLRIRLIPSE